MWERVRKLECGRCLEGMRTVEADYVGLTTCCRLRAIAPATRARGASRRAPPQRVETATHPHLLALDIDVSAVLPNDGATSGSTTRRGTDNLAAGLAGYVTAARGSARAVAIQRPRHKADIDHRASAREHVTACRWKRGKKPAARSSGTSSRPTASTS